MQLKTTISNTFFIHECSKIMWNYKTTTPKDYVEERCSFYEVALNDMVREVSVDSMIAHGEQEEVKSAPVMSVETAEFVFSPCLAL